MAETGSIDREGRVERVEAKIESQADRLSRIERALESALDRFSKAIDDLRDEIADSKRVNYAPMAIGVTVLLFIAGGYVQTTNDKIREAAEAGDNRLAAMIESNSDAIKVRHADIMAEIDRIRSDQDEFRRRIESVDDAARSGNAAAMRETASVKSILTWLQGKFEGEHRLNEWQSEMFRDFNITPKEPNDAGP
jgi:hypothetical protein